MHGTTPTFGGSHLDRYLIDYEVAEETVEVGGEAGAALSPDPAADADPTGAGEGEAVSPVAATDEAPAWTPEQIAQLRDTPEFRSALAEEADALLDARLRQISGGPGQEQPGAEGGGFDPNEFLNPLNEDFGANLITVMQSLLSQAQAPYMEAETQKQVTEGEERAKDILADIASSDGDFDQEAAHKLWKHFAQPHVDRYGPTRHAAEQGVRDAARFVRELEKSAHDKGFEAGKNFVGTLSDSGRGEPASSGSGAQTIPEANSLSDVTRRYAEQANAIRRSTA